MSTLYAPVDTLWSRVVARIERTSAGCWLWQGALNSQGYGCICSGRRSKSALVHHIAVAADGRPVPDGMTVDHQCHNGDRSCPGVGTDPETWRAADRMIDDAPRADS